MSYEIKNPNHHKSVGKDLFNELFTKEAAVLGAKVPRLVDTQHAGVQYKDRKKSYLSYAKVKAQEPQTGIGTAMAAGGVIGAGVGALAGGSKGAFMGLAGGGIVGAITKAMDDQEISTAQQAIRSNNSVDRILAARMAREYDREKAEDRAERAANTALIYDAVRKPKVVNNVSTSITNNRLNVRSTSFNKLGSAAVGGAIGGAIGAAGGYAAGGKDSKLKSTLLGAGAGAAVGAGIGFKPTVKGSPGLTLHKGDNVLKYHNGELIAATVDKSGKVRNIRKVKAPAEVVDRVRYAKGGSGTVKIKNHGDSRTVNNLADMLK